MDSQLTEGGGNQKQNIFVMTKTSVYFNSKAAIYASIHVFGFFFSEHSLRFAAEQLHEIQRQTFSVICAHKVAAISALYSFPPYPDLWFISISISSCVFSLLMKVDKKNVTLCSCKCRGVIIFIIIINRGPEVLYKTIFFICLSLQSFFY